MQLKTSNDLGHFLEKQPPRDAGCYWLYTAEGQGSKWDAAKLHCEQNGAKLLAIGMDEFEFILGN